MEIERKFLISQENLPQNLAETCLDARNTFLH